MTDNTWRKTACILCSLNCGLEVQTEGTRITKVRGDKEHPESKGYLCEKPKRLDRYQIKAPFDGTVISVLAEAGGMLLETDKIVMLADLSTLEANLHLPVDMYGALEVGALRVPRGPVEGEAR